MSKLVILYDPNEKVAFVPEQLEAYNLRQAILSIPDNLENNDIYAIAKKLAELLLEQLGKE